MYLLFSVWSYRTIECRSVGNGFSKEDKLCHLKRLQGDCALFRIEKRARRPFRRICTRPASLVASDVNSYLTGCCVWTPSKPSLIEHSCSGTKEMWLDTHVQQPWGRITVPASSLEIVQILIMQSWEYFRVLVMFKKTNDNRNSTLGYKVR